MGLVEIYQAGGLIEAESLRAALLDAEIDCHLDGQSSVGMPGLSSGWNLTPVGVLVHKADAQRADTVIDAWRESLPVAKRPPTKVRLQFSLATLFAVMTASAVLLSLATVLGASWFWLLVGAAGGFVPAAIMVAGYLRKERNRATDEEPPESIEELQTGEDE